MIGANTDDVVIAVDDARLPGLVTQPEGRSARGLVIFAHGSGSSRLSSRNRAVAATLVEAGCATLLFDLLTEDEASDRRNVFDIPLLAQRMVGATTWARRESGLPGVPSVPIGYFGASTGAAAALVAETMTPERIAAVVSRGGRPDLAGEALKRVKAPTLLIVGSRDEQVLELNRAAQSRLTCENELKIIPGATHLFEEPGTLEEAASAAAAWFVVHFG
jgi:putative phosphoribosyl transferase